jgi:hypothetical protein
MWITLDVSLGFIVLLLLVSFIGLELPSVGEAYESIIPGDPVILVEYTGVNLCSNLQECCFEANTRLNNVKVNRLINNFQVSRLFSSSENGVKYWMNDKAYQFCKKQVFWVG